jgi:hypothetical protein
MADTKAIIVQLHYKHIKIKICIYTILHFFAYFHYFEK